MSLSASPRAIVFLCATIPVMRSIADETAEDFDQYYADNTHVHELSAHDDELRWPDGEVIGDTTLTLEEYRARC